MENTDLFGTLNKKFLEIFPVNDIHLISFNVTSRKAVIITIMKKGGITLDDCKLISSIVNQFIPDDYDLQVQSPGIGYEIRKENFHILELFLQNPIKIFYSETIGEKQVTKEIEGILTFVDKSVSIKRFEKSKRKKDKKNKIDEDDNLIFSIPLENIVKIKTTFYPEEIWQKEKQVHQQILFIMK